ncbi:17852_t:CDS:2, partial [Dentiscutata erythropus]
MLTKRKINNEVLIQLVLLQVNDIKQLKYVIEKYQKYFVPSSPCPDLINHEAVLSTSRKLTMNIPTVFKTSICETSKSTILDANTEITG